MQNSRVVSKGLFRAGLIAGFAVVLLWKLAAAQELSPSISVTVNKAVVFTLREKAKRVSVSQPQVADVIVATPNQLLITGKAVGTTSLIVFDDKGEASNYDLVVAPDIGAARSQLRGVLPNEKIEISTSGAAIVLRGEVSNEVVYDKVLDIVKTYLPPRLPAAIAPPSTIVNVRGGGVAGRPNTSGFGIAGGGHIAFEEEPSIEDANRWGDKRKIEGIIDLLVIREIRQIELDVIVAEVATNKLREIGFDFLTSSKNVSSNTFHGSQSGFPTRLFQEIERADANSAGRLIFGQATSGIFSYATKGFSLTALYRLFQNKDVTEILAQPRMVMKNGRSGGFLAGGEFPVVTTTSDTFNVDFKPFGVRLDFVPTLTWSDRIDLRVFPEVSEIDQTVAVQGVPGLKVRRSVNRVELADGESLVIGGLLDRRILKDLSKFPLLGDIPVLGALFRSTRFRNQESELVFVITPRIVKAMRPGEKPQLPSIDKYDDPDIRQIPLPSSSDSATSNSPATTIP